MMLVFQSAKTCDSVRVAKDLRSIETISIPETQIFKSPITPKASDKRANESMELDDSIIIPGMKT